MVSRDELIYKLYLVINYSKDNGGYEYKLYDHLCLYFNNELSFNIVEYAEDVIEIILEILDKNSEEITIKTYQLKIKNGKKEGFHFFQK